MSRSPIASQQQNQWRANTKRQILGNYLAKSGAPLSPVPVDGSNSEHIKSMIDDLQDKYDGIITTLKSDLEDCKSQQEEAHKTGMIKLSKNVRNMTIKEFNEAYGCDLLSLLKSKDGVTVAGTNTSGAASAAAASNTTKVPTIAGHKRDFPIGGHPSAAIAAGLETPAPSRRNPAAGSQSALRTARRGEGLFSKNGSPLETSEAGSVVATVTKKRRGNESASFEINVGDGRVISLNDPNGVQELDSQMKATAASQLKVLQDQMASLMAQLTQ